MPRTGGGIYVKPFPDVEPGTTIESAVHNGTMSDIALQLNGPVPIIAGGTNMRRRWSPGPGIGHAAARGCVVRSASGNGRANFHGGLPCY